MIFVSIAQDRRLFSPLKELQDFVTLEHSRIKGKAPHRHEEVWIVERHLKTSNEFERLSGRFSEWGNGHRVVVLVSEVKPFELNPLKSGSGCFEPLLAMLILAFPEVCWLFSGIRGYDKANEGKNKLLDSFRAAHGLHHLFQPWQTPLFDGSGLRDWVRNCAKSSDDKNSRSDAAYLTTREQLAIAIDEESDYAYLHAYTAYRFGFHAMALTHWRAVEATLGNNAAVPIDKLSITLEDLYLNFPDGGAPSDKHMSCLKDREDTLPRLTGVNHRILITCGHHIAGDARKRENRAYIADQRRNGKHIQYLYKPHGGIFSVWDNSKLRMKLTHGVGDGYEWPPKWKAIERVLSSASDDETHSHSSPGVLLQIARHLLNRAERLLAHPITTAEEAIRGAVLATDALELLGGQTPTSAAEALALKHQFALHAECQFVGVQHNISLAPRFEEIERDAKSIARWFRPREKKKTVLNIQMDIINRLVVVLRQYNQFDEELECLGKVRQLQNSIYMFNSWRIIYWPFLRYSEFLLASFSKFMTAIFLWATALILLVRLNSHLPFNRVVEGAVSAFFAGNPIAGEGTLIMVCSTIAVLAGLAHLGIFISHLYVLVSKR